MTIQLACDKIEIVTDYEMLLEEWLQGPHSYTGAGARYGEAWKLFWSRAVDFGTANVVIRNVPAHKPFSAVGEGVISFRDWLGNRKADEMARLGAAQHPTVRHVAKEERDNIRSQQLIGKYIARLKCTLEIQWKAQCMAVAGGN